MFLNLLFVLLTKKVRKVLTGVLARILTLLLVYLLDDWHLNSYVLLNLAQLVFLSLRYVPLMTTFILISFIVFQYGHQIILQTWIVLLYFRKKWFVLLPKKHLMLTLTCVQRISNTEVFRHLFVSNRKLFQAFLLTYSPNCSQWLIKFIHIIIEIPNLPTYFLPARILDVSL